MNGVLARLGELASDLVEAAPLLTSAALVLAAFLLLAWAMQKAVVRAIGRRRDDRPLAIALGRLASLAISVLGLLVAAVVAFPAFRPGDLVTGLGIGSVAAGFAFKDVLQNYLAGILLLWRRPFLVGDEIRTGPFEGVVEDVNVRSTWLATYTGERVILPNNDVYTNAIVVRTAFDRRRIEVSLALDYAADLADALRVIGRTAPGIDGVLGDPGPWVHVTELGPAAITVTVYAWVRPPQQNALAVGSRLAHGLAAALREAGVEQSLSQRIEIAGGAGWLPDGAGPGLAPARPAPAARSGP